MLDDYHLICYRDWIFLSYAPYLYLYLYQHQICAIFFLDHFCLYHHLYLHDLVFYLGNEISMPFYHYALFSSPANETSIFVLLYYHNSSYQKSLNPHPCVRVLGDPYLYDPFQ